MIVRINQFDPANAEPYSGWAADPLRGALPFDWPAQTHAFELLILETDERQQSLPLNFRQTQLRQLLPDVVAALLEPQEQIVVRLDGPLLIGELLAAFRHLTAPDGAGRFAIAPVQKFELSPTAVNGSVRIQLTPAQLVSLCNDTDLGIEREVRVRLFGLSESLVNPLLDIDNLDDERWPEILRQTGFVVGNVRTLQAVHVLMGRLSPTEIRTRLMKRLAGSPP